MIRTRVVSMVLLLTLFMSGQARADAPVIDHTACAQAPRLSQAALDQARRLSVVFGHQSVGGNILEGLNAMAEHAPSRYRLPRLNAFEIGENGDPASKVNDFVRRLGRLRCDVAMMKLCFVDLEQGGSPARVFEICRAGLERVRGCRLVWWTMPLMTSGNRLRNDYNARVREYCRARGVPLFDLADIESHGPGGEEARDAQGPCLHRAWASDEGHLNDAGAAQAARAWWVLLTRLP